MFAASRSAHGRNGRRPEEMSVVWRVVMTPEKVRGGPDADNPFSVKLS